MGIGIAKARLLAGVIAIAQAWVNPLTIISLRAVTNRKFHATPSCGEMPGWVHTGRAASPHPACPPAGTKFTCQECAPGPWAWLEEANSYLRPVLIKARLDNRGWRCCNPVPVTGAHRGPGGHAPTTTSPCPVSSRPGVLPGPAHTSAPAAWQPTHPFLQLWFRLCPRDLHFVLSTQVRFSCTISPFPFTRTLNSSGHSGIQSVNGQPLASLLLCLPVT